MTEHTRICLRVRKVYKFTLQYSNLYSPSATGNVMFLHLLVIMFKGVGGGRGVVHGRRRHAWQGLCMAGGLATAADGMHATGMHFC